MAYLEDITLKYITTVAVLVSVSLSSVVCSAQPSVERDARLAQALNNPAWHIDERGRAFRVTFPAHDRLFVDYGAVSRGTVDGHTAAHQQVRLGWKSTVGLDFDEENIWWRFRHTFAALEYSWGPAGRRIEPTLIRADYLRHDMSSFIVIPMEQDIKLPAPFDIGVDYELGAFDLRDDAGRWSLRQVDVAQVAILMDFIRDPDYRHRLAVGPAGAYRIFTDAALAEPSSWRHELAPLSGAEVLYGWESDDGLYQLDLRGRCMSAVTIGGVSGTEQPEGHWSTGCDARARAEIIAFSVNDQPVSIPAEINVADGFGRGDQLAWSASVGLRMSLVGTL